MRACRPRGATRAGRGPAGGSARPVGGARCRAWPGPAWARCADVERGGNGVRQRQYTRPAGLEHRSRLLRSPRTFCIVEHRRVGTSTAKLPPDTTSAQRSRTPDSVSAFSGCRLVAPVPVRSYGGALDRRIARPAEFFPMAARAVVEAPVGFELSGRRARRRCPVSSSRRGF